jgi:hypothetical protein
MRAIQPHVLAFVLSSAVLAGAVSPPAAHAFDLTGTWIGKWSCKGFDGAKFKSANKSSILRLTQTGNTIAADLDNGEFHYNGAMIADNAKPEKGEAVFAACPNDNLPLAGGESEIIRAAVKTKLTSFKATFKGTSIFESNFGDVGSCKYTFKRRDNLDPNVLACPS